jgi:two-component system chemotaxis response regulator CheB
LKKIRILVVDDSAVVRRIIAEVLAGDPWLEVAGTAANGKIALSKIPLVQPDVITLDVDMPELSGIETLVEIRKTLPRIPVIMFSTLTERGAAATLEALSKGADDYVTKPAHAGSAGAALERIRDQLLPKIKTLCLERARREATSTPSPSVRAPVAERSVRQPPREIAVLAIGASTGGPNALTALIPQLPASFPVPIVIVQHMPTIFTRLFSERLAAGSRLVVREAADGEQLEPGGAWIAPGDHHMIVERQAGGVRIRTHRGDPENSCRPSVDVLFRSVAQVYKHGALALVLTGMGYDGCKGCAAIREAGGQVFVQDEASSVVWGMPGKVFSSGFADRVISLADLPLEISRRLPVPPVRKTPAACLEARP